MPRRRVLELQVALANLGRAPRRELVEGSLRTLRAALADHAILALVEIGEGDRGYDDHSLVVKHFPKWRRFRWRTREPLLVGPRGPEVRRVRGSRLFEGLKRWSPGRAIGETVLEAPDGDDPEVAVITGHLPAGARNGQRPAAARAVLSVGWWACFRFVRARTHHHVRCGRAVVVLIDANDRRLPRLHPRQHTAAKHGPDYILVVPPVGWDVNTRAREVGLLIEPGLHKGLIADLRFREAA